MKLYPLKFRPWLRTMVWGGEKIAPFKGVQTDITKIGESWEISGVQGHVTDVAEGPLEGRSIASLVQEFKGELVGNKVYAQIVSRFQRIVKALPPGAQDRIPPERTGPHSAGAHRTAFLPIGRSAQASIRFSSVGAVIDRPPEAEASDEASGIRHQGTRDARHQGNTL